MQGRTNTNPNPTPQPSPVATESTEEDPTSGSELSPAFTEKTETPVVVQHHDLGLSSNDHEVGSPHASEVQFLDSSSEEVSALDVLPTKNAPCVVASTTPHGADPTSNASVLCDGILRIKKS